MDGWIVGACPSFVWFALPVVGAAGSGVDVQSPQRQRVSTSPQSHERKRAAPLPKMQCAAGVALILPSVVLSRYLSREVPKVHYLEYMRLSLPLRCAAEYL